jgi:two-component system phosphate regulon sensor histidine kinase PhoR
MKAKLPLLVLLLVVLPTAVLSLLASRALQSWALVVDRRLQADASNVLQTVAARTHGLLERHLQQVGAALEECVASGASPAATEAAVARFRDPGGLSRQVYLFMNPWGFLYPADVETPDPGDPKALALLAGLRRDIATKPRAPEIWLTAGDASYAFTALPGRGEVFAGFEINTPVFRAQLDEALRFFSRGGLVIEAEGPGVFGLREPQAAAAAVVVQGPFGESSAAGSGLARAAGRRLAERRLLPPFDFIQIRAILENPDEVRRASQLQARLYGWGILLLAGGVLAGAGFVLREVASEIARARARSTLVMGLSHDLRTPVSSLKMLSESLYLDYVVEPAKRKKFLAAMVKESERLNLLVERVLFLMRFGQGALAYNLGPTDVGEVVRGAVEAFRSQWAGTADGPRAGVDVRVEVEAALPTVRGDAHALTQLLFNLLDNAAKYGGVPGESVAAAGAAGRAARIDLDVRVVTRHHWGPGGAARWVCIGVRDYGPGISRREQRRIFREFYRSPGAAERNVSGVGLGLAICRHVVRAHGGRITVTSRPGEGSTFTVYLPALREEKQSQA